MCDIEPKVIHWAWDAARDAARDAAMDTALRAYQNKWPQRVTTGCVAVSKLWDSAHRALTAV